MSVPIWIIKGFQQREGHDSHILANDTFYRPPVTSAQCILGIAKYRDSAILLKYDDDDYNQGYGLTKEAFKALREDDTPQPYISEHDFRSYNNGNNIGYSLYVFDIRYQKNFESALPMKVEFIFSENVDSGRYAYALFLTIKLKSISMDGQNHFDLVLVILNFFIILSFSFIVKSVFFNKA